MKFGVGQAVTRKEDGRFLTGGGRYVDDVTLPGQAHALFVRSPYAHARITGIERGEARAPLIVLKTDDLDAALAAVKDAGAEITKDIFAFPGGRRFQFREPGGTEMAVWTTD